MKFRRNVNYTPLTDDEQDVLSRLVDEKKAVYVEVQALHRNSDGDASVVSSGFHPEPRITWGDKRIQVRFPFEFTEPGFFVRVHAIHLKLKMRDGTVLTEDVLPAQGPDGNPVRVMEGTQLDLVWDVMLKGISSDLRKRLRPGLKGKTIMRGGEKVDEGGE